jgi:hypothetical protein
MSNSASATFVPTNRVFSRLIASIDALLKASARIGIRHDGLRYFGL